MRRQGAVLVLAQLMAAAAWWRPVSAITAREILDKAKELDASTRNWSDRTQHMRLTVQESGGTERHRELKVYAKRAGDGEEKAISFFLSPPEVQGVAFLQWAHKGRDDEQWLYLPEFRRTRQIAPRMRDERFMSTDFSYRDLEIIAELLRWTHDEAPATLVGEETLGGAAAYVIELRPHFEGMPYQRIVVWMDRHRLALRKLDFYDTAGEPVKSLTLDDYRDIGSIPTPHRLEMRTLAKGTRTTVELPEVAYNRGLPDELFTQRYLDRGPPAAAEMRSRGESGD